MYVQLNFFEDKIFQKNIFILEFDFQRFLLKKKKGQAINLEENSLQDLILKNFRAYRQFLPPKFFVNLLI